MPKKLLLLLILCLFFIHIYAYAGTCWNGGSSGSTPYSVLDGSGGSPSLALADIRYCLETVATTSGDIVVLPTGTGSLSTGTNNIEIPEGVILMGSGSYETIINPRANTNYSIFRLNKNAVITNIRFIWENGIDSEGIWAYNSGWRIHHNKFEHNEDGSIYAIQTQMTLPEVQSGLIDNNYFKTARIYVNGNSSSDSNQNYQMSLSPNFGTSEGVYIEDNTFVTNEFDTFFGNCIDSQYGGRYIARFNTIDGLQIMAHGMHNGDSTHRGTKAWEIYYNTIESGEDWGLDTYSYGMSIRGGTGFIFKNTTSKFDYYGGVGAGAVIFDNPRSSGASNWSDDNNTNSLGSCDGDNVIDGNTTPTETYAGYACRDQIGRGQDESLFTWGETPYPAQGLSPAYVWGNVNEIGTAINAVVKSDERSRTHIVANRDYYNYTATFDGTTGVGVGTLASMPTTCTTGVGYWATDQGDWNSLGDDGVLYKCTSTDTWEVYYEPYDYPHPLRGEVAPAQSTQTGRMGINVNGTRNAVTIPGSTPGRMGVIIH
jgi:hypothetical protein